VNTNNRQDTGNREKNVGNSGLSNQITRRFGLLRLNFFLGVLGASVDKPCFRSRKSARPRGRHGPLCHISKNSGTGVHHINSSPSSSLSCSATPVPLFFTQGGKRHNRGVSGTLLGCQKPEKP
jgi:hypothetical protein